MDRSSYEYIVLYTNDQDNDRLLINLLIRHFSRIHVITSNAELTEQLSHAVPKVILVAAETLQDTLLIYYEAIEELQDVRICEHAIVSLIPKHQEKEAYEAYRSGVINDYLIARPVYEMHRIIIICTHLLREIGLRCQYKKVEDFVNVQENYSLHIKEIVLKGVQRKKDLEHEFVSSLTEIDKALDRAEARLMSNKSVELDLAALKKILSVIRSNEIRPALLKLQNKALNLLELVVADVSNVAELAEAPLSKDNNIGASHNIETTATKNDSAVAKNDATGVKGETVTSKSKYTYNRLYSEGRRDAAKIEVPVVPKMLIVEDDHISLNLTIMLLRTYAIELDTSFSGRMALDLLAKKKYDVILMDINLPDTNGFYIIAHINKTNGINSKTPIVMLTGNKNKASVQQAVDAGAKGYIIKPLYKDSVVKLFHKYDLPLHLR
ncbi:response regulator [Shewanella profunda]|uniref:response regulator n=1 Tax=Shewanella profunda TaxID=254793 RepID=UPI00200C103D|nr:response regulator [Shewanella profunda]MCL1089967.1 response regulator [Shewanella profunda]